MRFEFSEIRMPSIPDPFQGEYFNQFKVALVGVLLGQRLEVFREQRSNDGPWAPLAASTLKRRMAKVPARRRKQANAVGILVDSGTLRNSFSAPGGADPSGPGSEFFEQEIGPDYVRIATNVPYARIHNEGGVIMHPGTQNGFGRGIEIPAHPITIKARPFDQFTQANLQEIDELTALFLSGRLP